MPQWPITEGAVVTTDDMQDLQVFFPKVDDETQNMPDALRYLLAIACKWKSDPEFVEEVLRWYEADVRRLLHSKAH